MSARLLVCRAAFSILRSCAGQSSVTGRVGLSEGKPLYGAETVPVIRGARDACGSSRAARAEDGSSARAASDCPRLGRLVRGDHRPWTHSRCISQLEPRIAPMKGIDPEPVIRLRTGRACRPISRHSPRTQGTGCVGCHVGLRPSGFRAPNRTRRYRRPCRLLGRRLRLLRRRTRTSTTPKRMSSSAMPTATSP